VRRRLTQLMGFAGLGSDDVEERSAGDLFVVAGFPEVEIGDTLADPAGPGLAPHRASTSRCCG
jgi:GTP-binding protein